MPYPIRTDRDPEWRPLDEANPPLVEVGSGLLAPVLVTTPLPLVGQRGEQFSVVHLGRRLYLRLQCLESEVNDPSGAMRRLRDRAVILSIATSASVRLQPVLLTDDLAVVWEEPKYVSFGVEEWLAIRPLGTDPKFLDELDEWIAREYPSVLALHSAGTFLLDRSYGYARADVYFAEALLGFFRIAEAVVAARLGRRASFNDVVATAAQLGSERSAAEIREIYVIRSAEAAHGSPRHVPVTRALAAKTRAFAEELVNADYAQRQPRGADAPRQAGPTNEDG